MARYHDKVGFLIFEDDQTTGIASSTVVERPYYGEVLDHTRRWDSTEHISDDLVLSNQIKITANDYAYAHMSSIAYARWMGEKAYDHSYAWRCLEWGDCNFSRNF